MSLTTAELRKQVQGELYQGWKAIRRAVNLIKDNDGNLGAIRITAALAQITASTTEHVDRLLTT